MRVKKEKLNKFCVFCNETRNFLIEENEKKNISNVRLKKIQVKYNVRLNFKNFF